MFVQNIYHYNLIFFFPRYRTCLMHRYLVFDDDLLRQKRLLVANTEMITEDRQLNVAHLNGKPEVITGVHDLFSRMKAVPTITVDLYPVQIPIFCCTRFLLLFPKKNFLET